jgi:hypothetical protein
MTKMGLHVRPIVLFDASNKLHRQWVTKFIETGRWGDCPVRFTVKEEYGNMIAHIQKELLLWYSQQEARGNLKTATKPGRRQHVGVTGRGFELTV